MSDDVIEDLTEPVKKRVGRPRNPNATHYVNNKDFHAKLIAYDKMCKEAASSGKEVPTIPNSIGIDVTNIARKLSNAPNFKGYMYRDEMVQDAIIDCIQAVHKFNVEKENPFGYFTRVCWNSFIKRIKDEKKELYMKCKHGIDVATTAALYGDNASISALQANMLSTEYMSEFMTKFEESKRLAKEKKDAKIKKTALDNLF